MGTITNRWVAFSALIMLASACVAPEVSESAAETATREPSSNVEGEGEGDAVALRAEEKRFEAEMAGLGLEAEPPSREADADLSSVTLIARKAPDLSGSGRLLQRRQLVAANGDANRTIIVGDTHLDVDMQRAVVELSDQITIGEGASEYAGQPLPAGLTISTVLTMPLDDYHAIMASPGAQPEMLQDADRPPGQLSTATVVSYGGRTVSFKGEEMSLENAIADVLGMDAPVRDEASSSSANQPDTLALKLPSPSCIIRVLKKIAKLSLTAALCFAREFVAENCGSSCGPSPTGNACIACVAQVLVNCGRSDLRGSAREIAQAIRECL